MPKTTPGVLFTNRLFKKDHTPLSDERQRYQVDETQVLQLLQELKTIQDQYDQYKKHVRREAPNHQDLMQDWERYDHAEKQYDHVTEQVLEAIEEANDLNKQVMELAEEQTPQQHQKAIELIKSAQNLAMKKVQEAYRAQKQALQELEPALGVLKRALEQAQPSPVEARLSSPESIAIKGLKEPDISATRVSDAGVKATPGVAKQREAEENPLIYLSIDLAFARSLETTPPINLLRARLWYDRAAKKGNLEAHEHLARVEKKIDEREKKHASY